MALIVLADLSPNVVAWDVECGYSRAGLRPCVRVTQSLWPLRQWDYGQSGASSKKYQVLIRDIMLWMMFTCRLFADK